MRLFAALLLGLTALAAPGAAQVDPKNALLERTGLRQKTTVHQLCRQIERLVADPGTPSPSSRRRRGAFLERRDAEARLALERAGS
jgi:hypothetical protein